jgi:hypothetical protein
MEQIKLEQKIIKQDGSKVWRSLPFIARKDGESQSREIMTIHTKKDKIFLCYESGANQFYSLNYLIEQGYKFFITLPTEGEIEIDGLAFEKEYKKPIEE